jgi:hypothetical protein
MNTPCQGQEKSDRLVVLVQPQMGLSGEFSRHPPLSLLFVASALKKLGIRTEILDTRVISENWKEILEGFIGQQPLWVGCTVMAGFR